MKFIADRMLGRLAKWLRVFGFDVYYQRDIDRASLIKIAKDENRVILTRARNFSELKHIPTFLIIDDDYLEPQLKQFFSKYKDLDRSSNVFSRCVECNQLLEEVSKDQVADSVPPKAYEMHDEYRICPACKRIYWQGTHIDRMKKFIEKFQKNLF